MYPMLGRVTPYVERPQPLEPPQPERYRAPVRDYLAMLAALAMMGLFVWQWGLVKSIFVAVMLFLLAPFL
jgi:hypothetical protein